jgi:ABC-type thiamin/hydroxymethylpyrimidine transport system permease subunit
LLFQDELQMVQDSDISGTRSVAFSRLGRIVLAAFLLTFISARIAVFLIMSRMIPDIFYLYIGETHIHHLNYGIFLLAGICGYLLFRRPAGRSLDVAAAVYGIGMALTFDEFGIWIHLGGGYWQRASWDAIVVVGACFGLIAFATSLKRLRPRHWLTGIAVVLATIIFFFMLAKSFRYAGKIIQPKLEKIEAVAPK